jgi:hypothetical protein
MNTATRYTRDELNKLHLEHFREIAAQYPKGHCVGVGSWVLRVGVGSAALVTFYRTKTEGNADWSGVNEYSYAL